MLMLQADSIMNSSDEAAKTAIKILDGIKPQFEDLSKAQKMRYLLLYHKAMNKADIPFTSDSTMKQVAEYYESHGSANDRMLAYYMLGCIYRDLREAPIALEYYNKATEQADTTSQDCDYATLCRVYSQMGILFDKQCFPYEELAAQDKAIKYAYLAKDTLNAIAYYQNKESAYYYLGLKDSAAYVNNHVAELFRKHGYEKDAKIALGCNMMYYVERKNYQKAKEAFEAYKSTHYEGNTNYADSKAFVLYEQGKYYMSINMMDSAYKYLQKSLAISKAVYNKASITKALAEYYTKIKNPTLASKYALLSIAYNDSDLIEMRKSQLHQMQAMYDYSRNQKIAKQAELDSIKRTYLMVILGIIIAIIILISVLQINKRKKKYNKATRLYKNSLIRLFNMQKELADIKSDNKQKIDKLIAEKEEAIISLKSNIKDIRDKFSTSRLTDNDLILKNTAIYERLKYIEAHPKEKMTQEDWQELRKTVEQIIPSFTTLFKGQVSEKDYKICLLLKFSLAPSTISNLIGISSSGVSLSRKRMCEKILGTSGTAKDFDEFVHSI